MTIRLVAEASDRFFPYSYPVELENPYDTLARCEMKEGLLESLDFASVYEFKIIEKTDRYDVLFRLPQDVFHFDFIMTEKLENPVLTSFSTPYKTKPYIQDTYKLKRQFNHAIEQSKLTNEVKASVRPENREVFVRAQSAVHYFDFWRNVPYTQRVKLAMLPG